MSVQSQLGLSCWKFVVFLYSQDRSHCGPYTEIQFEKNIYNKLK